MKDATQFMPLAVPQSEAPLVKGGKAYSVGYREMADMIRSHYPELGEDSILLQVNINKDNIALVFDEEVL